MRIGDCDFALWKPRRRLHLSSTPEPIVTLSRRAWVPWDAQYVLSSLLVPSKQLRAGGHTQQPLKHILFLLFHFLYLSVVRCQVPLADGGTFDLAAIDEAIESDTSVKLLHVQRSCGYRWRPSIPVCEIERCVRACSPNESLLVVAQAYSRVTWKPPGNCPQTSKMPRILRHVVVVCLHRQLLFHLWPRLKVTGPTLRSSTSKVRSKGGQGNRTQVCAIAVIPNTMYNWCPARLHEATCRTPYH